MMRRIRVVTEDCDGGGRRRTAVNVDTVTTLRWRARRLLEAGLGEPGGGASDDGGHSHSRTNMLDDMLGQDALGALLPTSPTSTPGRFEDISLLATGADVTISYRLGLQTKYTHVDFWDQSWW